MTEETSKKGFPVGKNPETLFDSEFVDGIHERNGFAKRISVPAIAAFEDWVHLNQIPVDKVLTDKDYEDYLDHATKAFRGSLTYVLDSTLQNN